jgi:hypothetical protein
VIDAELEAYGEIIKRWKIAFDATKVGPEKIDYLFNQLRYMTLADFKRAAVDWEKRGARFPKLADILESARRTKRIETIFELAAVDPDNPFCPKCKDSGWQELWCIGEEASPQWDPHPIFGNEVIHCGRKWPHSGHEFMRPCTCRSSNAVLKTKKSLAGGG